jgi:ankyrin repeat protein
MDIFQIIRRGSLDEFLNAVKSVDINVVNEEGENMLHEAIAYNPDYAPMLIDMNIELNQQTKENATPLHYAAHHKQLEIARKIIEGGGNLNIVDKHGNNPLWYAVFFAKGNYEMVQLFMNHKADPLNKNNAGRSALDFATQIKDAELIKILCRN